VIKSGLCHPRKKQLKKTPVSLEYPLSVFNKNFTVTLKGEGIMPGEIAQSGRDFKQKRSGKFVQRVGNM